MKDTTPASGCSSLL